MFLFGNDMSLFGNDMLLFGNDMFLLGNDMFLSGSTKRPNARNLVKRILSAEASFCSEQMLGSVPERLKIQHMVLIAIHSGKNPRKPNVYEAD